MEGANPGDTDLWPSGGKDSQTMIGQGRNALHEIHPPQRWTDPGTGRRNKQVYNLTQLETKYLLK